MTNAEHLIENAIIYIEEEKDFDHFSSQEYNKYMSEILGINLNIIWEMSQYIVWTLKPNWLSIKEAEMEESYGYKLH